MRLEREEFARQWSCPAREAQIDADLSRFKQAGIERQQVGWTVLLWALSPSARPPACARYLFRRTGALGRLHTRVRSTESALPTPRLAVSGCIGCFALCCAYAWLRRHRLRRHGCVGIGCVGMARGDKRDKFADDEFHHFEQSRVPVV